MKIRKSSFHPEIMTDFITVIDNVKQKSIHLKRKDSAVLRKTVLQFFRGELYCQKRYSSKTDFRSLIYWGERIFEGENKGMM